MNLHLSAAYAISATWLKFLGSRYLEIALPLVLLATTGQAQVVGLALVAEAVPWLITPAVLKKHSRRVSAALVILICNCLRAALLAALFLYANDVVAALIVCAMLGFLNCISSAFSKTLLAQVIRRTDIVRSFSIQATGIEVLNAIAPAAAAVAIAVTGPGTMSLLPAGLAFALSSGITILYMRREGLGWAKQETNLRAALPKGNQLFTSSVLTAVTSSEAARTLAETLFLATLIILVTERYDAAGVGGALLAAALGGISAGLSFPKFTNRNRIDLAYKAMALAIGLASIYIIFASDAYTGLCIAVFFVGYATTFRQLVSEIVIVQFLDVRSLPSVTSVFNSLMVAFSVIGYAASVFLSESVDVALGFVAASSLASFLLSRGPFLEGQVAEPIR